MTSPIRILDSAFLERLSAAAAAVPRRRKNYNLHAASDYPCHRFFNAMCANTYVPPHRHRDPRKDETVVVLRGRLGVVIFDAAGTVATAAAVRPGAIVDVPHDTYHSWCALEDGTIIFEAKSGPYLPLAPEEKGTFAPPEGDPRAPAYLAWLKSLCTEQ